MKPAKFSLLRIPVYVDFDDLDLSLNARTQTLEFNLAPVYEVMQANRELRLIHEEDVIELIGAWYQHLRSRGYWSEVAEKCFITTLGTRTFGYSRLLDHSDASN